MPKWRQCSAIRVSRVADAKADATPYIPPMAHNNGMVPKSGRKGLSENAAKFRGLAKPVDPAGTAYDPGPPENSGSIRNI